MMKNNEWLIDEKNHHQRLDNFLMYLLKDSSKSYVYKLIRQGQVRVNKSRAKAMQKLKVGDVIRLPPFLIDDIQALVSRRQVNNGIEIPEHDYPVIFEDSYYLVIDKPYGVPVHSGSGHGYGVIDVLRKYKNYPFLELAHRLDKETSGCLVLAKTREALVALQEQISAKTATDMSKEDHPLSIKKDYVVLLKGRLSASIVKIDDLAKNGTPNDNEKVISVKAGSMKQAVKRQAKSEFVPRKYYQHNELGVFTLVDVRIYTGRTHQIRVQSAAMELPVVGDKKYGDWQVNKAMASMGLKRMFLHAEKLAFIHPMTKRQINLHSPLDKDFMKLDNAL